VERVVPYSTLGAKQALGDTQGRKTYLQMGLVHAGITAGQLGYGDSHEDHEEAGGEVLVFCLTLKLVNRILENIGYPIC
jgi:hypothetical protein